MSLKSDKGLEATQHIIECENKPKKFCKNYRCVNINDGGIIEKKL